MSVLCRILFAVDYGYVLTIMNDVFGNGAKVAMQNEHNSPINGQNQATWMAG